MDSSKFLGSLYDSVPGYIALWRADRKSTEWASTDSLFVVDGFAEVANADNFDAYFSVCLQGKIPKKKHSRGLESGVSVMPGLWVDVDFASDQKAATKKPKRYPPESVARKAIGVMPAPPTVIVQSGGGLHVYWLFDKPVIVDDENRAAVKSLSHRWQQNLRARLLKLGGYEVDSTHDLSRVLRLPGTPHTKHPGFTVGIDGFGGGALTIGDAPRHSFADLNRLAFDPTAKVQLVSSSPPPVIDRKPKSTEGDQKKPSLGGSQPSNGRPAMFDGICIPGQPAILANMESEPSSARLFNLMEADQKFKQTFNRRVNLASPSEYDMTLANYAINAGWPPVEAAGLLVMFARMQFPEHLEKLLRVTNGVQDYLHRTIGKAFDKSRLDERTTRKSAAVDEVADIVSRETKAAEAADQAGEDYHPAVDRETCLRSLSEIFGVRVLGWKQTGIEEETFSLVVQAGSEQREIIIGSASRFASDGRIGARHFKTRIYAEARRTMVVTTKIVKEWDDILQLLSMIVEEIRVDDTTLRSRAMSIVAEHLARSHGVYTVNQKATRREHIGENRPFIEGGILYISSAKMREVASHVDKELTRTKLTNAMRQAGFDQKNMHGDGATRSYYFQALDDLPFRIVGGSKFDPAIERKVELE